MPIFHAHDGTELAYRLLGKGAPLICLPGGPMRAGAYLGDLGGLSAHRQLVVLDLRGSGDSAAPEDPTSYRCDRLTDDIEALREHLGEERIDLLAHSASGNLASLYAARHPQRLRTLTLVTPGTRAVGITVTDGDWREASELRREEPWFADARAALDDFLAGRSPDRAAVAPFAYGRWDETARAHAAAGPGQTNSAAAPVFYQDGVFDPAATNAALAAVTAPVLVLAGEYDAGPTPDRAAELVALFPDAEFVVQRGAAHFPWLDDPGAFVRAVAAFLDPEVHSVQAGGTRLAHRVWGDPSAPPVVLAHGRCGDSRTWIPIAERLAAQHRVYAFDFRGHGLSDWPGRYSFELFRDDLHAFLEARNLAGATVIGHSMGAAAACLLAAREPGLIGRLVLEEMPPPFPLDPPRARAERPDGELDFDWPVVPSTDAQLNAPDPDWSERLGEITAPTLVIGGGPTSRIAQEELIRLAGRIPDGRFVTIDAGHLVHTDRPEEFLAELRAFGLS
ncbi:alpha/beta hydrolase [Streptomyces sp. NBC_00264]|uniref:alpha/beta fold hydrolase n=1 Tax=unclassified Streptomyces TaxID=2593676 RepID=UPI000F5C0017|nr:MULTISPECIES: alpha/beta hydrolase [unclassified Streptomyces]WSG48899.1 alpha/beta hydrolase [Streptomyces sp. NBC_01732]WSW99549.1 alpha/beta hydrolase [Streptomyces sp. NBC_00987]MCX5098599.1 alpha/beta hydrolase [Streptomyces sp. NBC_00439]MCX5158021.1 alpha/beta hydrolase [Streptomyces sp. NBC_00305]MCX5216544.1 alpha/beta hydrolase [Streptomyces sp. NBC_00264]